MIDKETRLRLIYGSLAILAFNITVSFIIYYAIKAFNG
jgi:hypothetical protein